MSITRIILNRLLLRILPIIALYTFMIFYNDVTFDNIHKNFGLIDLILIAAFVYYCYDFLKLIRKVIDKKKSLQQAQLNDVPTHVDLPSKLSFLDKRVSINDKSIDIYFQNKVVLHLSKAKKQIEIKKTLGKKILSFNDIQFLFLEYNQYEKYTFIEALAGSSSYDKNVWNNSIMAMSKNGKQIKLFEAKLEETNYEQLVDYQISGKYEEKSYLENGKKMVRLFSHFTNKKYLVLNNVV